MSALHMTSLELGSTAWHKVAEHADQRINIYRSICENPNESESRRFEAAVRVSEIKKLLELAQPARQTAPTASE